MDYTKLTLAQLRNGISDTKSAIHRCKEALDNLRQPKTVGLQALAVQCRGVFPSATRPMVFCTRRIASLAPMRPPLGSTRLGEGVGPRCANMPSKTDFKSSWPIGLVR